MSNLKWDQPVTLVKNIGAARAKLLEGLCIHTVGEMLEHFPRDYQDRSKVLKIEELLPDTVATIEAKISDTPEITAIKGLIITKVKVKDETGSLELVWYNQPYLKNNFKKGQTYLFTGKVTEKSLKGKASYQMQAPDCEERSKIIPGRRILPVYSLKAGLSQKIFRGFIKEALAVAEMPEDLLPEGLMKAYELPSRRWSIVNIHFPENDQAFFIARKAIVFEELFLMQLSLLTMKSAMQNTGEEKSPIDIIRRDETKLLAALPFEFTDGQRRVLDEIKEDITSNKIMTRLVQGDVGSGKTAVAMAAAYLVIQNGYQAAMMAPTEVLARQHYESVSRYFEPFGIKTVILTGSINKNERKEALEHIKSGEASMIIGTHALIQDKVIYNKLGLVITDEQHRFGVQQRSALFEKGEIPHVLVMSATPIPRTLGLILYGDMDISIIDSMPPGRQSIDTFCVGSGYRKRIYAFIQKEADAGRQAYVICPAIDNEDGSLESVTQYTKLLKQNLNCRVEAVHGKMPAGDKQIIMDEFKDGKIQTLVSTTVVEVGVNVPNATLMVIENAERFGLSQLHQLRGRVGRGSEKSYCILVTDNRSKVCKARMKAITDNQDGFVLSELDLKLRGPGDFFGVRQHGLPEMMLANLYQDMDVLRQAQQAAIELSEVNWMEAVENRGLKEKVLMYLSRCAAGM